MANAEAHCPPARLALVTLLNEAATRIEWAADPAIALSEIADMRLLLLTLEEALAEESRLVPDEA